MKRYCRWLFNIAAGASLLLGLAVAVLWVRSYWFYDFGPLFLSNTSVTFESRSGLFVIGWRIDDNPRKPVGVRVRSVPLSKLPADALAIPEGSRGAFGFRYWAMDLPVDGLVKPVSMRYFFFPHWALGILLAVLPAVWFVSARRRWRREAVGLCPTCGYDLRATPDRCPECGAAAAVKGTAR